MDTGEVKTVMKGLSVFHRWHPGGDTLAVVRTPVEARESFTRAGGVLTFAKPEVSYKKIAVIQAIDHPWLEWSPDGKWLIFCAANGKTPTLLADDVKKVRERLGPPKLFMVSSDRTTLKQLTNRDIGYATFSPDGKHILFVELKAGGKSIVGVMKSDGTGVARLDDARTIHRSDPSNTEDTSEDIWGAATFQPVWLSNTRVLYYKNPRTGFDPSAEIWAIDIDGKHREDFGGKLKKLIDALPKQN